MPLTKTIGFTGGTAEYFDLLITNLNSYSIKTRPPSKWSSFNLVV